MAIDAPTAVAHGAALPRTPEEAVQLLLRHIRQVAPERTTLDEAIRGRILAEPITADRPSPAVDVSAMDGYAVRLAELAPGRHPVTGEARIGSAPPAPAGGVLRITTGAPVPEGFDAVIRREDVTELQNAVEINAARLNALALGPGANIRRRGENIAAGEVVAGPGRAIDPPLAAALASFGSGGVDGPLVYRKVRIAILTTGDELLATDSFPAPWQIRDSNGPALRALCLGCPWLEIVGGRRSPDEPAALRATIEDLLSIADALLITGGVSMGDRDFVPAAVREIGAQVLFHKLPQRPGKPVLGAVTAAGQPIFALPGNPVSVMVTARRMAAPVLAHLAGITRPPLPPLVTLDHPPDKRLDLWWHRPVRLIAPSKARIVAGMGSGDIVAAARSDGFVEIPPGGGGEAGSGPWPFYSWTFQGHAHG